MSVRIDKSVFEDRVIEMPDGREIPYKARKWSGPEEQRAIIEACRRIKAEGLDSNATEMYKQDILKRMVVGEIDGESASEPLWNDIDGQVDYYLRMDLFGVPGEAYFQTEMLKNFMPTPESLQNPTH